MTGKNEVRPLTAFLQVRGLIVMPPLSQDGARPKGREPLTFCCQWRAFGNSRPGSWEAIPAGQRRIQASWRCPSDPPGSRAILPVLCGLVPCLATRLAHSSLPTFLRPARTVEDDSRVLRRGKGRRSGPLAATQCSVTPLVASGLTRMHEVAGHVVTGAEGQEAVAATLDLLKSGGWVVLHDRRRAPRSPANIHHLVVGPMGLLVIDAKKWSGRVTFRNGTLRCNGYSRQSTITDTVEVADLLRVELAIEGFGEVPITAVLCFEGDAGVTRPVEVSPSLFLVPRSQLTAWLAQRPG
jgi:hypothetical protein